jgi:hypothetical protein
MSGRRRKRHPYLGKIALSDFDPEIGEIIHWKKNSRSVRIRFFERRVTVKRDPRCIFIREQGSRVCEFDRGNLFCKVREYALIGHPENARRGSLFTATWHRRYATGYQQHHMGGEGNTELYAIIIDDKLVYRPHEYLEISSVVQKAAGAVSSGLLCTL